MGIVEQIEQMLKMQDTLNESIINKHKEKPMTKECLKMAVIDELGELTHELKGDWCWWKNSQAPVNRQRVLEELVDVWHFVMTWELKYHEFYYVRNSDYDENADNILSIIQFYSDDIVLFDKYMFGDNETISKKIENIIADDYKLEYLLELTKMLGFTFDEVYTEYLNKNKENYERLKNGY